MNKSSYFFGQSVFGQLISLIDSDIVKRAVKKHNSDYYTKKFSTSDHLISMLFSSFANCSSLREVAGAMLGLKGKTNLRKRLFLCRSIYQQNRECVLPALAVSEGFHRALQPCILSRFR